MCLVTEFQQQVYDALGGIPRGKVTTYKVLADFIGCNSCQAVGQALKVNPFAPEVPCHRVIKSDLSIGGYQGEYGTKKTDLLLSEGIEIENGKLVNREQLFNFGSCE